MKIKVLKTETDYENAMERIEAIFDAKPDTPKGDELELLTLLVEKYEEEHYPIELPHPIEAIKFRMDQMGLKQKDIVDCFGDKSKVSDVLNLKRKLNLNYIRNLHKKLYIPLDALVEDYETQNTLRA
ncbi:helix-turn-helix domain-containing protein [Sulfurovum mangrovi]|uniref:helix-turn-helix domain-containing protein n=1 Tax=Sulfurovum mangrovi TaxID=2893889 RepID=UPI001E2F034C|nr:DNA-binding protein [Sulfurovum mangrovi]UFH58218.1 DNA-binding protein [Sulfurovum mangrovi]